MKFTWAHAAILIPILIVVVFTSVLIVSMSEDRQEQLVTEDYYAKELDYQSEIDNTENALGKGAVIEFQQEGSNFHLQLTGDFSPTECAGTVHFFRPSNEKLDVEIPLQLDSNGVQVIEGSTFQSGRYQIQINWELEGANYYLEKNVFIP
jgi:hypothetical protein